MSVEQVSAVRKTAVISDDYRYRYTLVRQWGPRHCPVVTWVMLNPSTADHQVDDPTIRRCMGFSRDWGYEGIRVVNLYALRATDPRALWKVDASQRVGPENDDWLRWSAEQATKQGTPIIAAWGAHAKPSRVAWVCEFPGMDRLQSLGVTKAGAPRHPLYLPAGAKRRAWPGEATS